LELLKQGLNHSEKGKNYTLMVSFPLQDWLVKMACIQAASRLRNNVEIEDVEYAYVDLAEFFQCTLDFINEKIAGNLDYGKGPNFPTEEDMRCLEWLISQNATSEENSRVSINNFTQQIMALCNINNLNTANYRYTRMKRLGWIDSKQVGQYETRVWITPQGNKGIKGDNLNFEKFTMEEYLRITDKISKLAPTPTLSSQIIIQTNLSFFSQNQNLPKETEEELILF